MIAPIGNDPNKAELGDLAQHILSGFTGIVIGATAYLTTCEHVGIRPEGLDKDGKTREPEWFDVDNCIVLEKGRYQKKAMQAKLGAAPITTDPSGPIEPARVAVDLPPSI